MVRGGTQLEQRELEVALEESEQLTRGIFAAFPGGVVHAAPDGSIRYANAEALRLLGMSYDELTQRYTEDFDTETIWEDGTPCRSDDYPVTRALVTGQPQPPATIGVRRPDGGLSWCTFRAVPVTDAQTGAVSGAVVTFVDITDRKQAEEERVALMAQLNEARRLEALGRLAGGIAHDFNNLLTVILGNMDMLRKHVKDGVLGARLEEIGAAAVRASELTRQLLAFGRKQPLVPRIIDLGTVVATLADMLRRLLGEHIELTIERDATLGSVCADPLEMERVVMNLAMNAQDAMPMGGTLVIATRNYTVEGSQVPEGRYVALEVRDTGAGMDAGTRARMFEPFYTTKESGTGLGLATVHGIVNQSGGFIMVESERDRGTIVRVLLPRLGRPSDRIAEDDREEPAQGSETILILEDEPEVRQVTRRVLEAQGYRVIVAETPAEALGLRDELLDDVQLLLSDVVMPLHSGFAVAEQLTARAPHLKVLFMSGHLATARAELPEGTAFVSKPFDARTLAATVRAVLDDAVL